MVGLRRSDPPCRDSLLSSVIYWAPGYKPFTVTDSLRSEWLVKDGWGGGVSRGGWEEGVRGK